MVKVIFESIRIGNLMLGQAKDHTFSEGNIVDVSCGFARL
jgi:hypothetical protein